VVIVDNGASAIEAAMNSHFHLTLMDIQIPVLDGKEATRQLRALGYVKPIVALTAHAMREERESCLLSGCDGQITKPVSERDFLAAVEGFLVGSRIPQDLIKAQPTA
jgi:CheY-like chemotaxis protein